ncbi:NUDIX hydrolase domain-like protein [Cadophora sp. MPI-SDFR-AT-0126]|nr:NUDIX hydrolase domain-like protein [Leotiomycetes sp. MPI-SDFR-AT-0126]
MASISKSYLDLVNDCDSFPYDEPFKAPHEHWSNLYRFFLPEDSRPHGLMLPEIVKKMPWTSDFCVDHTARTIYLKPEDTTSDLSTSCTNAFSKLIQRSIDQDNFTVIHKRHSELYPIVGYKHRVKFERYAGNLFGFVSRGAHLTVYSNTEEGMKIWVPRRSAHLFTYPNCLDTTVAGGVSAGEGPFECIVREADEEASLAEDLVRKQTKACGCITYVGLTDPRGNGEQGLLSNDLIYVYDLELPEGAICRQNDDEVKEFNLMSIEEVKQGLRAGEFKTNSALVMIDFFIRHGVIKSEEENNYAEIMARLHRKLPLPTSAE